MHFANEPVLEFRSTQGARRVPSARSQDGQVVDQDARIGSDTKTAGPRRIVVERRRARARRDRQAGKYEVTSPRVRNDEQDAVGWVSVQSGRAIRNDRVRYEMSDDV